MNFAEGFHKHWQWLYNRKDHFGNDITRCQYHCKSDETQSWQWGRRI